MSKITITIYIWSAFWIYWILSAINTRSKVRKESSGQKGSQRAFHLIFVVIAFIITFFQFENIFLWNKIIPHTPSVESIGIIILILSLLFAIWARLVLGMNWSGAIQKVAGQRLVCSGPYKYIRNPIYTGVVFGFLGNFIVFGTIASLIGFVLILFVYVLKISKEQKFLVEEFGDEYKAYIARSWALIPFVF
ncbi:isoprenylcysteine carboxylmethyltransferase family protein [Clostridium sp. PL3]|uniref:Isoprenylcysteine carboxylmethyltransferase family protein n=1 Tax=Clostridium thailandense TaxID=2794346 RepID=A0A949TZN4_9CLOT|nr:isoprenylcysteine carboxylmethyltransferase family protein [Clostridium thailandense]MBV7276626.1 isoprenylcysteine carboxylmethyltransferase family protein [Clostridium thailandense]